MCIHEKSNNVDQIPISFSHAEEHSTEEKGVSSVLVTIAGVEKLSSTVMLSVTSDRRKLLPYVIFKTKTVPKGKFLHEYTSESRRGDG
jgi:hypothetical protein